MPILAGHQAGKPLPAERWTAVTMPVLVVVGAKSPGWLHNSMRALARALPNASLGVANRQTHRVKAKLLAPQLTTFFTAAGGAPSSELPAGASHAQSSPALPRAE